MSASVDIDYSIKNNYPWSKLSPNIQQALGNSQKEYEKAIFVYSVKNQLRYKGNLVKSIRRDERRYYEDLLLYSKEHLMLYPYHLSDVIVKGLRVTPFNYYIGIVSDIMAHDKSYDCLPNFTAADCLRLLGIGRNQYIDLMNQCRSSKKFFRKKPVRELLPLQPVDLSVIDSWWRAQTGFISEEDIRLCVPKEKVLVDTIIDKGAQVVGDIDIEILQILYKKGLVYLDVPIEDEDCIVVPPLEGFVMNRVTGDYFETLLYNIFVSIDEHTAVSELASVLQIDLQLVKNAISVYCRLGFAKKKTLEIIHEHDLHWSWKNLSSVTKSKSMEDQLLLDWKDTILEPTTLDSSQPTPTTPQDVLPLSNSDIASHFITPIAGKKRIAFMFDSTLTAFLMMGNLSPGLKSHAVTMFEVGKLTDESMDSFLCELEKVDCEAEGEARRYFDHAVTLRDTIKFLRYNKELSLGTECDGTGPAIDLIRCESLYGLDAATRARILNKNYELLVSMAPLSNEIRPISSCIPYHIGPAIPEVSSIWFKLFLYHITGSGPPSVLIAKGSKLRHLPSVLRDYEKLLVTTWGHDPAVIATSNILITLNDVLTHSAILVQAHGWQSEGSQTYVPFPHSSHTEKSTSTHRLHTHPCFQRLKSLFDLHHNAGYVTFLNTNKDRVQYDNDSDICVIRSTTTSSSASIEVLNDPLNGIKDVSAAQILAQELDCLHGTTKLDKFNSYVNKNDQQKSSDKTSDESMVNLQIRPEDIGKMSHIPRRTRLNSNKDDNDIACEQDWVLLDCNFGIPIFDSDVNQEVCSRILESNLCHTDSLQKMLDSHRKLTLQLLDFISQFQDGVISGAETKATEDLYIPYPTANLIFCDGVLQRVK